MSTKSRAGSVTTEVDHPSQVLRDRIASAELAWLAPLSGAGTAMVEAWADLFEEQSSFVARRVRQDVRSLHRILQSRNPRDLQSAQIDFFQGAFDDYLEECSRFMARLTDAGRGAVAPDQAPETAAATEATPV